MRIWLDCIKEKLTTYDARMYAKLEIVRLVEKGELSTDMSDMTPIDDPQIDHRLVPANLTIPSEDRATPTEEEALDAIMGPLPANPPQAPLKLKPRLAPPVLPRCHKCGGVEPCHQAWCSFVPNAITKTYIPPIPSDGGAPASAARIQCLECNYMAPYHTQWCTTGHRIRNGTAPAAPIRAAEPVDPSKPKPGDKIPARFPFCKDRTVPYAYDAWPRGEFDELDWRGYD